MDIELKYEYLERRAKSLLARQYYANKNDILRRVNPFLENKKPDNPLRNADNRISHNWYQLLVDQKASYTMGKPPTFNAGDDELNDLIKLTLGIQFSKITKDLCINASNDGRAWLHVWQESGTFHYAVIDDSEIIPIYGPYINDPIEKVWRVTHDGTHTIWEEWDKLKVTQYKTETFYDDDLVLLEFPSTGGTSFHHNWGRVPFIPFKNNSIEQSDLEKNKSQIDTYDKIYSGYVDDLDDIQEIIFVLTNYSGTDKKEFLSDLNEFKMVKLEQDDETEGKIDTLAIDIPVEARTNLLQTTRENIFVSGQGVDPLAHIGNNNSGSALKYMYSLLELKASMLTTEFELAFDLLLWFIFKHHKIEQNKPVRQVWTRTSISNDSEHAEIVNKLQNVTSIEAIAHANPLVNDPEEEIKRLHKEVAKYGSIIRDVHSSSKGSEPESVEGKDGSSEKRD